MTAPRESPRCLSLTFALALDRAASILLTDHITASGRPTNFTAQRPKHGQNHSIRFYIPPINAPRRLATTSKPTLAAHKSP